jgi:two-component sensor histidine kinase
VQALSMTMHELATNAAKHGALSVPEGRLDLRWTIEDGVLCIRWNEQGGPPVGAPPSRQGFGSSLITATMTRQLGGRITASWRPNGLEWTARLPVERLVPGREPPEPLVEEVGEPQAVHQAIQQAAQEAAQQSAQQSAPAA